MLFMKAVTKKMETGIFTAEYTKIRAKRVLYNPLLVMREK